MEYQLAALKACNITDIAIVVGHCGSQIRKGMGSKVTILENEDYKSTNSSYSLWLARDFIKDGFIYINSDLIFDYRSLRLLLKSSYRDAIITDEIDDFKDDMFNAQMEDSRTIQLDKKLNKNLSSATVVGPARFSREGLNKLYIN